MTRTTILPAVLLLSVGLGLAPAREPRAEGSTEVLLLGTFHFANPGLDLINVGLPDMGSDRRQAELAAIVDSLASFEPTKILLEMTPEDTSVINERYRSWRDGERKLGPNEHEQLGMRLADLLDLDQLYGIDARMGLEMEEAMAHAAESGQGDLLASIQASIGSMQRSIGDIHDPERSIAAVLRDHNDPVAPLDAELYMTMVEIGDADDPVGADLVATWYRRNLRIFANLLRTLEDGDERVLVIYGSGHRDHLTSFIRQHPELELASTLDFLPED